MSLPTKTNESYKKQEPRLNYKVILILYISAGIGLFIRSIIDNEPIKTFEFILLTLASGSGATLSYWIGIQLSGNKEAEQQ